MEKRNKYKNIRTRFVLLSWGENVWWCLNEYNTKEDAETAREIFLKQSEYIPENLAVFKETTTTIREKVAD